MDGFILGLKKFLPGNLEDLLGIFGIIGPIIGAVVAIQYLCDVSRIERCFWSEEKKIRRKTVFWILISVGMLAADYIIALIMLYYSDALSEDSTKEGISSIKLNPDSIDKIWRFSLIIIIGITIMLFLMYFYESHEFRTKSKEDDMSQEMRITEFIFCWIWVNFVLLVFFVDLYFLDDKENVMWLFSIIVLTVASAYILIDDFYKEEKMETIWFRLKGDKRRYSICSTVDDCFVCEVKNRRNKKRKGSYYILVSMSKIIDDRIELHIENHHDEVADLGNKQ